MGTLVARKNRPSAGYDPMTRKWINHRQRGLSRTAVVGMGGGDSGGSESRTGSVASGSLLPVSVNLFAVFRVGFDFLARTAPLDGERGAHDIDVCVVSPDELMALIIGEV